MFNFELLFLHGFSSKSCLNSSRILRLFFWTAKCGVAKKKTRPQFWFFGVWWFCSLMVERHLKKVWLLESPTHCPFIEFLKYVEFTSPIWYAWKTFQESILTWITQPSSCCWFSKVCWLVSLIWLKNISRKYVDLNHPVIVLLMILRSMLTCITHMFKRHLKKVCWLESPSHCPVVDFPKYVDLHHPYD